jgi:hypothetical protein
MSDIESTLNSISACAKTLGKRRLADVSGVPYPTLRDMLARGFENRFLDNLKKLEAVAKTQTASQSPPAKQNA